MRSFAENAKVLEVFKGAALSTSFTSKGILIATTDTRPSRLESTVNPITLRSKNPCDYRNDVLAKIIPRILNPLGISDYDEHRCMITLMLFVRKERQFL